MRNTGSNGRDPDDLDRLVEEITTDACGDGEQLRAFHQAFKDGVAVPCDGFVIGEPVSVVEFDYDGNERRGLTARCRCEDGSEHVVSAAEVVLPQPSCGARYVAAYPKWLGLVPFPPELATPSRRKRRHKAAATDLDLSGPYPDGAGLIGSGSSGLHAIAGRCTHTGLFLLDGNTLVMFTSDNGPWAEMPPRMLAIDEVRATDAGSSGLFRGSKGST